MLEELVILTVLDEINNSALVEDQLVLNDLQSLHQLHERRICGTSRNKDLTLTLAAALREDHPKPLLYSEKWVPLYLEEDFHSHFRMTRQTFFKLEECINAEGIFNKVYRGGNMIIPSRKCLEISLWYLTHEDSMHTVADKFGVVKSTVCKCVHLFCEGMELLAPKFIVWPNETDCKKSSERFLEIGKFPGVIGCIDGTHIPIKAPDGQISSYTDRYMKQSLIVQGICNQDKLFTNVFVGYPGSAHDSRVLLNSGIYERACNSRTDYFPSHRYHLLGDSAYGLKEWLLTPYRDDGNLTRRKRNYNIKLSKCRVYIEHAFGLVKKRFKKLHDIDVDIKFASSVIYTCFILHNFCFIHGDTVELLTEETNTNTRSQIYDDEIDLVVGQLKRDEIASHLVMS